MALSKSFKRAGQFLKRGKDKQGIDFNTLPKLLTLDQVSEILSVHPNTLRNWDRSGKLTAVRIGPRKDRRYEKDVIHTMYESMGLRQSSITPEPEEKKPEPEEKSYVIKPGFSLRNLRLYFLSRRFSIFVYSVGIVAFTFMVLQTSFFAYMYVIQAREKPLDIYKFRLEPAQLAGWQGSSKAKTVDLLSSSTTDDFTDKNSAVFHNRPITDEQDPEAIEEYLAGIESEFEVGGYKLPEQTPAGGVINKANIKISLAADTYEGNEDVVSFSYSFDGDAWVQLESFALTEDKSNAVNQGYWTYPLEITEETTLEDLENIRVKVAYNAVPGEQESIIYLDGITLDVEIQEPNPVIKQIEESVGVAKRDFGVLEQPKIEVALAEGKFFGIGAKDREVKSVKITDPSGQVKKIDYEVKEVTEGNVTRAEYAIDTSDLTRPGKYTVSFDIEQEGRLKTVKQDFTWGVLAFNPDQSVYKSGQTATFSIGVVDDHGQPVCDAEVTVEVTGPDQGKTIFTTNDGSITISEYCTVKDVYVEPDYWATFTTPMPGDYQVYVAAVHSDGRRTMQDSFLVELFPTYTVKREGPTRVFPNVLQPMRLTVTAYEDFNGEIKDYAQRQFNIEALDGGIVRPFDTGEEIANEIVWSRSIPAGTSVTVSYNFDAPPKSPALFHLGPAKVGDWDEGRQWQLAIDPANMLLLGKTSSAPGGWSYVSTYNGRYILGSATYSGISGNANHGHTVASTVRNAASSTSGNNISGSTAANAGHAHSITNPTVGNAQNIPAYARFTLWSNDSGIPSTVPQNAYALFDADPGGSWTRYSTADNRLIQLNSAQGTGGSDTHTHPLTWKDLGKSSGTITTNSLGSTPVDQHSHTAPSGTTSDPYTSVPQYTTSIIYEQTNATPQAVPYNMMALFDATPPTDWTVVSGLGGDYDARFVQGNTTEGTKTGSNTHNMADETSGASGSPSSTFPAANLGIAAAGSTHTHTQTSSFNEGTSHIPQYVNVIIAQYKGITVGGQVYQNDEFTEVADGQTVDLYVNGNNTACAGAACTTTTDPEGVYSFSNVAARSGDIINVYMHHGLGYTGTTVLVSNGATVSDLHIYDDTVAVRHDTGTSITNADLETGDAGDDYYVVSGNNLTVGSGHELHIWTGDTYDPGGTVTTNATGGDMHVDNSATAYLDTATNSIGIDIDVDASATLNVQASTTVNGNDVTTAGAINHSAGTFTIGNSTVEDLIVNSGAAVTLSGGTTDIKDIFDINGGTVTVTNDLDVGDDIDQDGGILNINAGDVDVVDRVMIDDVSGHSETNLNGGTLDMSGYLLVYEGDFTLAGTIVNINSATNFWYLAPGTGDTVDFSMTGGSITTKEIYVPTANTLNQTTVSGGTIILDNSTSSNFDIRRSGVKLFNATIADNTSIDSNSVEFDVLGTFTINTGKTFDLNGESLSVGESLTSNGTCASNTTAWDNDGTFTHTNGTVTIQDGDMCGDSNSTFFDLDISSVAGVTVTEANHTVAGTLTVEAFSTLTINSGRTVTHTGSSFSLVTNATISGAGKIIFTSTSSGPGASGTLSSLVRYDATGGDIVATTFDARTYGGNVEAFSNVGSQTRSLTMAAGTQQFNGNLTVTSGIGQSLAVTLDGSNNPTVNVTGSLSFQKFGATPAIISGTDTWTMTGSTINFSNGTYTATAGNTLKINNLLGTLTPAGNTFQNFEVFGGTTAVSGAMDVDGTLTLTSGTFRADDNTDLSVAGHFTIESGAAFDDADGSGKLILDGDLNFWDKNGSPTNLGEVEIGTSPDTIELKSDFKADSLTINVGDNFNTHGYDLDIGGDITTGALSTLNATDDDAGDDTYINLEGTLTFNSSTVFTEDQSTVTFDATSGTQSIVTNGIQSLYNLVIDDGGGGSLQVDVDDTLVVNGDLTITDGRLDLNATTNVNLDLVTVNDILNVTAGTFTVGNGTTEDLVINAGSTVGLSGGTVNIMDDLDHNGGTTTISNTVNLSGGGTTESLDIDGGTVNINTGADVNVDDMVYLTGSGSTLDLNDGSLDSTDSWYIDYGTFNLDGGDHNITNGILRTTITSSETLNFNMTGGALTVGALVTESPGILNTGTPSGSTINIGGSYSGKYIEDKNANAHSFYNMVIEEDAEINTDTTQIIKLDGSLTIDTSKTFTVGTEFMQIDGGWTGNGALSQGNGLITLRGGTVGGTTNTAFYNLKIDDSTVTVTSHDPTVEKLLEVTADGELSIGSGDTVSQDNAGSVLTLDGTISGAGRLTYMSSTAFPTSGIISSILRFDATDTDQTMSDRTYGGAVEVYNTSNTNARTVEASTGSFAFSSTLTLTRTGTQGVTLDFYTNDTDPTVTGTLTIGAGTTFSATENPTELKGDYTNNGTFTHNSSTVTINGTSQQTFDGTMTGSSAFNNLTITNATGASPDVIFANPMETDGTFTLTTDEVEVQFEATSNYTFNDIDWNGTASDIVLTSSSGSTAWNIKVETVMTESVSYINVTDSGCQGGTQDIWAFDGTNTDGTGNGACWLFDNQVDVSGVLYDTSRSTPFDCTAGPGGPYTINISTSGRAAETTTCTASDGTFTFTDINGPLQAGDPVIVYVDSGETPQATTVTRGTGPLADITLLHMYQNDVIVRHEDTGPLTNVDMNSGDNGDTGIRYVVQVGATNNLTVDSGLNLYVWTGDEYDPGGTVTLQGTADLYIDTGATAALDTATNVITDDIDNYGTLNITATTNVTDDIFVRAGSTLNSSSTTTSNDMVYVYGDLNVTGGTFTVGNGTTEDLVLYTGGTFDPSGGTTDIKDDLWISTGGVATITADVDVVGMINVDAGTLNVNTGADLDIGAAIDQDGGTININDGAVNLNSVGVPFSIVYVDNAAFNVTGGTLTVGAGSADDFQVNSGSTVTLSGGTVDVTDVLDINGGVTTITNTVTVGNDIDQDGGTLTINSGADVDVTGTVHLNDPGTLNLKDDSGTGSSLDTSGTWFLNEGTFNLYGGDHSTGTDGSLYLANQGSGTIDFNMIDNDPYTDGQITTGYFFTSSVGPALTTTTVTGGTINIGSAGFSGTRYIYLMQASVDDKFYNITIEENAEINASSIVAVPVAGTFTINTGKTFDTNGEDMNIGSSLGSGTCAWDNDGSFTYDTSTITLQGGDYCGDAANTTFYNLTIDGDVDCGGGHATIINNTLDIDTSDTLTVCGGSAYSMTLQSTGSLTLDGTLDGVGNGQFIYRPTAAFPTTGTIGSLSVIQFDLVNNNITMGARGPSAPYAYVEVANSGSGTYTLTLGTAGGQTVDVDGWFIPYDPGAGTINIDGDTYDPTVNIDMEWVSTALSSANINITSGTGTWTMGSFVNFNYQTFTATSGNTIKMTGVASGNDYIRGGGNALQNFEVDDSSADNIYNIGDLDVDGTFTLTDGEFSQDTDDDLYLAGSVSLANDTTFTKAATTGQVIFNGTTAATYADSTDTPQNLGDVTLNKTNTVSPPTNDKLTLLSDMTVDTLSIDGGGIHDDTLDLGSSGYTLELANAGSTATVLTVDGTLTPGTSTVKYSATNSGGNVDVTTTTYNSLQLSGSEIYDLAGHLTSSNGLTGNLTIDSDAILDVTGSDYGIDLAGNWTNSGGEFEAQAGTVTLDGISLQTLSGIMTALYAFNDLTVTNSSGTDPDSDPSVIFSDSVQINGTFTAITANTKLQFQASQLFVFSGMVLNGQDTGTRIYLRSTTGGSAWQLSSAGGTASYVNVQDSHACAGGSVDASDGTSVDSDNNECWNFGVTVSGTLYLGGEPPSSAYDCSSVNKTIAVVVNGSLSVNTTECENANGTWSVDVESPPQPGDPIVAYIDDETGDVGTTVTRASGISADISNMDIYEDAVIVKHEDAGPITNNDLFWAHGGDEDIIYGLVGSDLLVDSGVELHVWTGGTIVYDPGGKVTIQGTGGDLHVDDDATAYIDTATSAISDDVYVDDGATLDIQANTTVSGGAIITSGTDATVSYTGTPTVTISGTGDIGGGTTPSITFYNLIINGTQTMVSATTTDNDLTVGETMKGSADVTTMVKGSIVGTKTINMTGGTVEQRIAANETFGTTSGSYDWTFNNLTFSNSSGSNYTVTTSSSGSGDTIVNGTITVGPSADSYDTTLSNDENNRVLDIENVTIDTHGELQASASEDFTVSGNWSNSGTFTHNNGTVSFDATDGDNTVAAGNSDFYWVNFSGADSGNGTWTVQTDDFSITDTLNVNDGDTLSISNGRTVTWSGSSFTLGGTISGDGRLTIYSSTTIPTTGTLSSVVRFDVSDGLTGVIPQRNFGSDVEAFIDDVAEVTRNLVLGTTASQTINISGNLDLIDNNVAHLSLSGATNNPDVNVTGDISISGTNQSSSIALGDGDWDVDGSVTIATSATIYASATGAFNVGGNWTNSGVFTANSGTVNFNATDAGNTINPGASSFYNLYFGASGNWSPLTNQVTVTNDLTMGGGTFDTSAGTADVEVNGNINCGISICGTINMATTNTFTQSVSANAGFGDNVSDSVTWTFNNLIFDSSAGTPTIALKILGVNTLNVLADLSLTNNGTSLTVDNETQDWIIDVDNDVFIGAATELQASSTADFTVEGSWANSGTFTANSGTVTFDSDNWAELINGGSSAFNNVVFDHAAGGWDTEAAMDVDGTFDLTNGQFGQGANVDLNVAGNFTLALGTTFDDASGTGKLIFDGDLDYTDSTSPQQDVGNVEIGTSPDTTTLKTDMTATTVNINNGDTLNTDSWDLDIGSGGVKIKNGGTLDATSDVGGDGITTINTEGDFQVQSGGTFTEDDSTIIFDDTSGTDNLITDGSGANYSINNLTIDDGGGGGSLTVDVFDDLVAEGTVTITDGTLDVTSNDRSIAVGGDWLNADTFTAQNGTVTFDATDTGHTINTTASSFYDLTFDGSGGGWSPNSNLMAVSNDMIVTNGSFNNSAGTADVIVNGNVQCGATCGTINMTSNTFRQFVSANKNFGTNVDDPVGLDWIFNFLDFKCASGTCDITINGTGTGDINVLNNLYLTNVGTSLTVDNETNDRNLDIDGNLLIENNTTFQASSTATFEVGGNWTNNGDFTDGTGIVILDGTAQQTVSGQLTGASDRFNNLTITNASGADPDVIFSAAAETAGTFLAETAGTQIQFDDAATYTFQNIDFDGQDASTRVVLTSDSPTNQWDIDVAGTRSVYSTDVMDSNACNQPPDIDATHISNKDSGNTDCWDFTAITFTLSINEINLGTLSTSAVNTSSHTVRTVTSADSGYTTLVYDDGNFRKGADDINDVGDGAVTAASEEYGIGTTDTSQDITNDVTCGSAPYSATGITTTQQSVAGATSGPVDETITVCYAAAIDVNTIAGSYAHTVTYVTVGLF